jgi:hypothetical protein
MCCRSNVREQSSRDLALSRAENRPDWTKRKSVAAVTVCDAAKGGINVADGGIDVAVPGRDEVDKGSAAIAVKGKCGSETPRATPANLYTELYADLHKKS